MIWWWGSKIINGEERFALTPVMDESHECDSLDEAKPVMMTLLKDLIKEDLPSLEDIEGNRQAYSAANPMEQCLDEKSIIVVIED